MKCHFHEIVSRVHATEGAVPLDRRASAHPHVSSPDASPGGSSQSPAGSHRHLLSVRVGRTDGGVGPYRAGSSCVSGSPARAVPPAFSLTGPVYVQSRFCPHLLRWRRSCICETDRCPSPSAFLPGILQNGFFVVTLHTLLRSFVFFPSRGFPLLRRHGVEMTRHEAFSDVSLSLSGLH